MKPSIVALLFSTLTSAHIAWQPQAAPMIDSMSPMSIQNINSVSVTIIATTVSSYQQQIPTPTHKWDPLVSGMSLILDSVDDRFHLDLRKRQGGVGATANPAITAAVPMPTVTTYSLGSGAPALIYTQTFVLPLEPWPAPQVGTVGMGTIQGPIGVVKTISKRDDIPIETAAPGQKLRIRGRGVDWN